MIDVILFHSSSEAMWASRVLKKNKIEHKLISVPRHLGSDCGYCVSLSKTDSPNAMEFIRTEKVPFDRLEQNVTI
ncbi:MAG TPA: DUF3343 domain-containing protein [Spirochaetota bacterium]|nr:DUF3343 domain-containing protein [Spirochaetota bacterium]